MIHQYKSNGYNIVLDVNSGSVHVVDDLTYDIISMYEDNDKDTFAKKKKKKKVDTEDNKYFPFTQGKGLLNSYNPKLIEGIEKAIKGKKRK